MDFFGFSWGCFHYEGLFLEINVELYGLCNISSRQISMRTPCMSHSLLYVSFFCLSRLDTHSYATFWSYLCVSVFVQAQHSADLREHTITLFRRLPLNVFVIILYVCRSSCISLTIGSRRSAVSYLHFRAYIHVPFVSMTLKRWSFEVIRKMHPKPFRFFPQFGFSKSIIAFHWIWMNLYHLILDLNEFNCGKMKPAFHKIST